MPNITIQVSEELYQHARLSAARRNMTVSALVRALLLTLQQRPEETTAKGESFDDRFKTMPEFSIQREAEERAIAQYYKNRELYEKADY
jgi:hypothetical protein